MVAVGLNYFEHALQDEINGDGGSAAFADGSSSNCQGTDREADQTPVTAGCRGIMH